MAELRRTARFSVLPNRLACWGSLWVALAMVLAIGTAFAVHGLFESQPRYFVMYQCFWVVLVAAVWQKGLELHEAPPVSTD